MVPTSQQSKDAAIILVRESQSPILLRDLHPESTQLEEPQKDRVGNLGGPLDLVRINVGSEKGLDGFAVGLSGRSFFGWLFRRKQEIEVRSALIEASHETRAGEPFAGLFNPFQAFEQV
jgi:hypothetical protein